jgi:hypothetical protein
MRTYVARIGDEAVLAFRADDDEEAHEIIENHEGLQSDLKMLVDEKQCVPASNLETRQSGLRRGWNGWQSVRPLRLRNHQRSNTSGASVRHDCGRRVAHRVDLLCNQVVYGRSRAAIWYQLNLDIRTTHKQKAD